MNLHWYKKFNTSHQKNKMLRNSIHTYIHLYSHRKCVIYVGYRVLLPYVVACLFVGGTGGTRKCAIFSSSPFKVHRPTCQNQSLWVERLWVLNTCWFFFHNKDWKDWLIVIHCCTLLLKPAVPCAAHTPMIFCLTCPLFLSPQPVLAHCAAFLTPLKLCSNQTILVRMTPYYILIT